MTYPAPQPAPRKRRTGLIVAIVVIISLAGCGIGAIALIGSAAEQASPKIAAPAPAVSDETTATPAAEESEDSDGATARVGESLSQTGDTEATWTVTKTERKTVAEFDIRPKSGSVFLLAHVKVSVTEGSEFVCGCNFQFVTKSGKVYEITFNSFKGRDELTGNDVAAGQNADGWVAFEVPKTAIAGGKIKMALNTFTDTYGYWTL